MSTLDHNEPDEHKVLGSHGPKEIDASAGYEQSDVKVTGIVVFLTSLAIFVAVCGVVTYGIGKLINAELNREDGPNTKWTTDVDAQVRTLGNLPTSPDLQNKVAEMTKRFPTPRVQTDDGNLDVADLRARYDAQLRTVVPDPLPEGLHVERDGPLLRFTGYGSGGGVAYRDLAAIEGAELDELIARQVRVFAERGEEFEWKRAAVEARIARVEGLKAPRAFGWVEQDRWWEEET